ncbi:MAG: TraB/GumN family protein [Hyphomicrobiaceae bacterium]
MRDHDTSSGPRHGRRPLLPGLALVLVLALLAPAPLAADETGAGSCGGHDLLAVMATEKPELHAKVMAEAAGVANQDAVFWRVERDGLAPSWLLGTIHIGDPRVTDLAPETRAGLDEARIVAIEIGDASPAAVNATLAKHRELLLMPGGHTLADWLSSDEIATLKERLQPRGLPPEAIERLHPWLLNVSLALSPCRMALLAKGGKGVDLVVADIARKAGKPVVGLETIEEQLQKVASVPLEFQIANLQIAARLPDNSDDMMETLINLYVGRRLGAVLPMSKAVAGGGPLAETVVEGYQRIVIDDRNLTMRDRALPLIEKGGAFIAVGSAHLIGEKGLVALLREAGYKVTPLN